MWGKHKPHTSALLLFKADLPGAVSGGKGRDEPQGAGGWGAAWTHSSVGSSVVGLLLAEHLVLSFPFLPSPKHLRPTESKAGCKEKPKWSESL